MMMHCLEIEKISNACSQESMKLDFPGAFAHLNLLFILFIFFLLPTELTLYRILHY